MPPPGGRQDADGSEMAVEDIMAQVAQAAQGQTDGSFLKAAENTVFRLFGLMLSDSGGAASLRRTARSNLLNLVLFLVDWVQLSAILMSPATGYTFSWGFLQFLQQLSLLGLLGIDTSTIHAFIGMWVVAAAIIVVSLANAGYVAYQVRVGFSGSLLPVRTLRAAVSVLLTAGYVPLIEVLAEPLSCSRLQLRSLDPEGEIPCWGVLHATLFTLTAVLLIGFVSFALLMRSVYFADAPLSGAVMAKPIARNEFWDTVARTVLVLLALFLSRTNPMLMTGLFAAMFALLTVQALLHLPYFKLGMTQLRVATYCGLVWMALGGIVAQNMKGSPLAEPVAAAWLATTVVVLGLGARTAVWRQRWMERKGVSIARFHMALQAEEAEEAAHASGGVAHQHGPAVHAAAGARAQAPASVSSSAVGSTSDAGGAGAKGGDTLRFVMPASQPKSPPPKSPVRPEPSLPGAGKLAVDTAQPKWKISASTGAGATGAKDARPLGAKGRTGSGLTDGVISATAALAHSVGRYGMQLRRGNAREAEDVADLLRSGRSRPGFGSASPRAHSLTPGGVASSKAGLGAAAAGPRKKVRRSSVSFDDDDVLSGNLRRRLDRKQSQLALEHAAQIDDDEDVRGAFVMRRDPTAASTPVGRSSLTPMARQRAGAQPPGLAGELASAKAADSKPGLGTAPRPAPRLGPAQPMAAPPTWGSTNMGANAAVLSFVAALRSELGHNSTVPRLRPVKRSSKLSVRSKEMVASADGVPVLVESSHPVPSARALDHLVAIEDEDPELDELLGSGPDPSSLESHASHIFSSDTDVELFVRALLARPSQRRMAYARALLDEAMKVFPDSVFVRLTFTTYLFSRSATYTDTMLAMRLLAEASTIAAPLDLRFAVFSKLNSAMNARRRLVLGDGQPGMRHDSLDLVEFKKGVKRAGDKHRESVSLLLSYWTTLAHGGSDGITVRGKPVTEAVSAIIEAADEAEKSYLSVLERWPSSQQVQRAYGIFLVNVRNDKEMGEAYLGMGENADDDDDARMGGSVGGGSHSMSRFHGRSGGSVGMRSAMSGASLTSVENIKRRKLRLGSSGTKLAGTLRDITRMRNGFRLGLLGLLAIIVIMFVLASTLFAEVRLTVATMNSAGLRRALALKALYNSRGQRLAAVEGNAAAYAGFQKANLGGASKLHTATEDLYFRGPQPASINAQWVDQVVNVKLWNPDPAPGKMRFVKMGLLDASNLYVANSVAVARQNLSTLSVPWEPLPGSHGSQGVGTAIDDPFYSNTAYRYIIENHEELVAHLDTAADLYQQANVDSAKLTDILIFALSGIRFALLGVLAWLVVRPAIIAIRGQRLVLRSLVLAVPRKVASHMSSRLKAVNHAMSEMAGQVSSLEELDPTTKTYTTLRNAGFLTTLPRAKPKRSGTSRHHSRGVRRPVRLPPQALGTTPAEGSAPPAPEAVGFAETTPVSTTTHREEDMYAIPEESDGEESDEHDGSLEGDEESEGGGIGQSSASARVTPSSFGSLAGELRQPGGAAAPREGSVLPGLKPVAEGTMPDAKAAPDDYGCEPGAPVTPFGGDGGDGNLINELDLLESVHDADELAQLLVRRRDQQAIARSNADVQGKDPRRDMGEQGAPKKKRRIAGSKASAAATADEEAATKLGLCNNPSLRSIVMRAAIVMIALVGLMSATTAVISTFAALTTSKPAELNAAGRRRMLAVTTVNNMRELILADGQVMDTEAIAATSLKTLERYERIHNALRLGDPSMGLPYRAPGEGEPPALTSLYYGAGGKVYAPLPQDALGYRDFEEVGLDLMLRHFWETARRVISAYANVTTPRPNRTLSGLLSVPQFNVAWEMERGTLQSKLGRAVEIYTEVDTEVVDMLEAQAYVVLSVEVVVLAIAYLLVYEGISTALVSEHLRAKDIRELVPPFIMDGTPELLRAYGSGSSSRGG